MASIDGPAIAIVRSVRRGRRPGVDRRGRVEPDRRRLGILSRERNGIRGARCLRTSGRDCRDPPLSRPFIRRARLRLGEPGNRLTVAAWARTGHADAAAVHRRASQPFASRPARRHAGRREGVPAAGVQARARVDSAGRAKAVFARATDASASLAASGLATDRPLSTRPCSAPNRKGLLANFCGRAGKPRLRTSGRDRLRLGAFGPHCLTRRARDCGECGGRRGADWGRDSVDARPALHRCAGRSGRRSPSGSLPTASRLSVHCCAWRSGDAALRRSGADVRDRRAGIRLNGAAPEKQTAELPASLRLRFSSRR